ATITDGVHKRASASPKMYSHMRIEDVLRKYERAYTEVLAYCREAQINSQGGEELQNLLQHGSGIPEPPSSEETEGRYKRNVGQAGQMTEGRAVGIRCGYPQRQGADEGKEQQEHPEHDRRRVARLMAFFTAGWQRGERSQQDAQHRAIGGYDDAEIPPEPWHRLVIEALKEEPETEERHNGRFRRLCPRRQVVAHG